MGNAEAQVIHDFWYGKFGSTTYGNDREIWYNVSDDFDASCKTVMGPYFNSASSGLLDWWTNEIISAVSLCLLLDQYPRNAFRGGPNAFSTDTKAREISQRIISNGLDRSMIKVQREFVYMPFMHSENLEDQQYCLELFINLGDTSSIDFAVRHLEIIKQFGRFPHRNSILGRENTPEEENFLTLPFSSF